jgi:hypothetical protein
MTLLAPLGLAALIAAPIIILFHMRHTTPPRRPVPSLRFWLAANPRPAEERRLRRPPLSLALILQLVAAALIALALARPATAGQLAALAPGLHSEPKHLMILLDGSTSMSAIPTAEGPTRWETARAEALRRIDALREGDVATLIVMGTRPLTLTATDQASRVTMRERLNTLPLPGGRADLDAALALAGDLILPNLERQVVVITDGAVSADPAVVARVNAPIELMVAGGAENPAERANLAVIDMAARPSPDGTGALGLSVSVANFGPEEVSAPVTLLGDGQEIGHGEVPVAGNGGVESLRWTISPGIAALTARIDRPDTLMADNSAMLLPGDAETAAIAPHILLVSDLPGALARALAAIDNVQLAIEPSDNQPAIVAGGYDLVVFDRAAPPPATLAKLHTPSLWVGPPVGGPFATTASARSPRVTRVRAGDPLLDGVDLAGATFGPTPVFTLGAGDEEIVGTADGPLLYRTEVNGEPAVVLTIDPEASNLPKRVAFPVLVANLVAALAPEGVPASVPLGAPLVYSPGARAATVLVRSPAGRQAELTVATGAATGPLSTSAHGARDVVYSDTGTAGAYTVTERDAGGNDLGSARFVVNAGHPRESDLRDNMGLAGELAGACGVEVMAPRQERVDFWPILGLAALLVIGAEWLVALLPRRATRGSPA